MAESLSPMGEERQKQWRAIMNLGKSESLRGEKFTEEIAKKIQLSYGFVDWERETPDGIDRAYQTAKDICSLVQSRIDKCVLTPEEIELAWDIIHRTEFTRQPTKEEILSLRRQALVQAQLDKIKKELEGKDDVADVLAS